MKLILENPLVIGFAEWVWHDSPSSDTADHAISPELCLATMPVMNGACWSALLAKGLGVAIILGACLNKAPLIYNIWTSQSTQGLSAGALYGELLVVAHSSLYGILMEYRTSLF